jgi:hypothetical protein
LRVTNPDHGTPITIPNPTSKGPPTATTTLVACSETCHMLDSGGDVNGVHSCSCHCADGSGYDLPQTGGCHGVHV